MQHPVAAAITAFVFVTILVPLLSTTPVWIIAFRYGSCVASLPYFGIFFVAWCNLYTTYSSLGNHCLVECSYVLVWNRKAERYIIHIYNALWVVVQICTQKGVLCLSCPLLFCRMSLNNGFHRILCFAYLALTILLATTIESIFFFSYLLLFERIFCPILIATNHLFSLLLTN